MPTIPSRIRPIRPERSCSVRMIIPTVAVMTAHTKILPMCWRASASPSLIVRRLALQPLHRGPDHRRVEEDRDERQRHVHQEPQHVDARGSRTRPARVCPMPDASPARTPRRPPASTANEMIGQPSAARGSARTTPQLAFARRNPREMESIVVSLRDPTRRLRRQMLRRPRPGHGQGTGRGGSSSADRPRNTVAMSDDGVTPHTISDHRILQHKELDVERMLAPIVEELRMGFETVALIDRPAVSIFGSARTAEDDPWYAEAVALGAGLRRARDGPSSPAAAPASWRPRTAARRSATVSRWASTSCCRTSRA